MSSAEESGLCRTLWQGRAHRGLGHTEMPKGSGSHRRFLSRGDSGGIRGGREVEIRRLWQV